MNQPVATRESATASFTLRNRLLLARRIATSLMGVGGLYLLVFNAVLLAETTVRQPSLFVVDGVVAVVVLLVAIARLALRTRWANLAIGLIVGAAGLGIAVLDYIFVMARVLDPLALTGIGSFLLVIVLAHALGDGVLVVITTVLSNVLSLGVLYVEAMLTTDAQMQQRILAAAPLLVPQVLLVQWAVAVILFMVGRAYHHTLIRLEESQQSVERSQKLDYLKDQFIASVNHELRNPVMAIMGYLDIIDLSMDQGKTDRLPEHVQSALRAGFALRTLINSILDVNTQSQSSQEFTLVPVEVSAAVTTALALLDPRERARLEPVLQVAIPEHLMVWGEAVRLQQILTNLLSNAAKYTPPGTLVEIRASMQPLSTPGWRRKGSEIVEIVVRDAGLGIPPDQIPLLFNRFVRLPRDLASNVVGNGLGLYLCRVLAEAMGGKIWVESRGIVGEGATFHLLLPVPPAADTLRAH